MTAPTAVVGALVLLLFVGCDGSASAGSPSSSDPAPLFSPLPVPPSAAEPPSDARTTLPTAEERSADCPPAVRVAPRALSAEWPARLGQRVVLRCHVVRAVGITEYLVVSDGVHFVVLAEPNSPPCTPSASTFVVSGAAHVADHGRVKLPQLVVDYCGR